MKNLNPSPVVVISFNRPNHLNALLKSLVKNPTSKETEVYIFIDKFKEEYDRDLNNEVINVANKDWPFKKVIINKSSVNKGLKHNIIDSLTLISKKYESFIVLEDDIEVSPKFLEYMNESLKIYRKENIFHINGYNYPNSINRSSKVYINTLMSPWGWATWSNKWNSFVSSKDFDTNKIQKNKIRKFNFHGLFDFHNQIEKNLNNEIKTWAIFWYQHIFINEGYTISPGKSYVKNNGFDGTGINSGKSNIFETNLNLASPRKFQTSLHIFNTNTINSINWSLKRKLKNRLTYHFLDRKKRKI